MKVHVHAMRSLLYMVLIATCWLSHKTVARAEIDLVFFYENSSDFSQTELQILDDAFAQTETMWETVLTGYQPGISITTIPIEVRERPVGLANALRPRRLWQHWIQ
jgi:hypothetical protein